MNNPFESGHIKNYLLLYASIVVIMVLFFIAVTLFHTPKTNEKKVFDINISKEKVVEKMDEPVKKSTFKLLEKGY
ncbi:MAG: hypothetical protein RBR59_02615 [Sulfurimonadaceae bacterium]|jgi:hypothetical protein|nr:hypothetical protein [Sulfurimonadaceae bacterium]